MTKLLLRGLTGGKALILGAVLGIAVPGIAYANTLSVTVNTPGATLGPTATFSEIATHPAGEDHSETGLAQIDLSVRVPPKMGIDLGLQGSYFGGQGADDSDHCAGGSSECFGRHWQGRKVLGVQGRVNAGGSGLQIPLAACPAQQLDDRFDGQCPACRGVGAAASTASASRPARSSKACRAAG